VELFGGKHPIDPSLIGVLPLLPGIDFQDKAIFVINFVIDRAVEPFAAQDADLDLDHVLSQLACLGV
jgi:hypothetical protein